VAVVLLALAFACTATVPAEGSVSASRCRAVPADLARVLRAGLSFPSGAKVKVARAVASRARLELYFVSLAFTAAEVKNRTLIGTWAVNNLTSSATVVAVDATARGNSDWARPDPGAGNVSMRTDGALASRRCVTAKLR
jgi:hypothetical protein